MDVIRLKPHPGIPNLWREFAALVMRRPRPSALAAAGYPVGKPFSVASGPVSSILVPVVVIGMVGDVPLSMVVVTLAHASHPMVIHFAIAATYLLSLAWVMAVRSTLRSMPHVVSSDALWIGGCIRMAGVIPKAAIESAHHLSVSRFEWMKEQGIDRSGVLLASGFDPPNVALEIKPAALEAVRLRNRKKQVPARRWILLYADSPAALVHAANASTDASARLPAVAAGAA